MSFLLAFSTSATRQPTTAPTRLKTDVTVDAAFYAAMISAAAVEQLAAARRADEC